MKRIYRGGTCVILGFLLSAAPVDFRHFSCMASELTATELRPLPAPPPQNASAETVYQEILKVWAEGKQDCAEEMIEERRLTHPDERNILFLAAVFTRSRFNKTHADAYFAQLVAVDATDLIGQCSSIALKLDRHEEVDAQFHKLRVLSQEYPKDPMVLWLFGIECREHNRNELGAEVYARLCALVHPGGSLVHQTYANILDELLRYDEALQHRRLTVELEPASWSYNGLGNTLHAMGMYEAAAVAQREALKLDPRSARMWRQAAASEYKCKRYERALQLNLHALQLNPREYWAWVQAGQAQEALGQWKEALVSYQQAASLAPDGGSAAKEGIQRVFEKLR